MSPSVRTFGKYLLDEEIARGGMSRVYSARLRGLGGFEKRLVVKQVLPELARDPRFVSMFVHEAKTLVQMSHPHIAPVYELGVVDGVYFLAMELVEGATLAQIVRDGPLAPGLVAHLGTEVSDALHYAHTRFDIVHRDVTPRNVIVDAAGHSRLLDFGIATPLSDEESELFGTPGYLSPEQLEGGGLGPASDLFGLGAVLFEALTGRRAFEASTVEAMRTALEGEAPRFEEGEAPPELAAIVMRALSRDPKERQASARELGRALRGWLASAHPEGVAPELGVRAERAEREERRRLSLEPSPSDAAGGANEVRTIATSHALDVLLEAPAGDEDDGEDVSASTAEPGTARIPGRRARTSDAEPSVAAIGRAEDERDGSSVAESGADGGEDGRDEPTTAAIDRAADGDTSEGPAAGGEKDTGAASDRGSSRRLSADDGASEAARGEAGSNEPGGIRETSEDERRPGAASTWSRALPWLVAAGLFGGLIVALQPPGEDPPPAARPSETALTRAASEPRITEGAEVSGPTEPAPERAEPDEGADPATEPSEPPARTDHEPAPRRAPEQPTRATIPLRINASPWAEVRLDGRAIGRTPQRRVMVRPGRHTLELSCPPLGRDVRYAFDAEAGAPLTLVADLERDPPVVRSR